MNLRVLDALRGLAALYVVVYHANGLLWDRAPDEGLFGGFVRGFFSFGPQAVLLFFVISGFCIHYRQAQLQATRLDLRCFAWRRFRRLYPPLLLAIALTAALDWLGNRLAPEVYAQTGPHADLNAWFGSSHTLTTLMGNLFFQGSLLVPQFGTNAPLWSLALEFWFYALYPLLLVAFGRYGPWRTFIVVAAFSTLSQQIPGAFQQLGLNPGPVFWWPLRVLYDWPIWVLGAFIAHAHARGFRSSNLRRYGAGAVPLLLGMGYLASNGDQPPRFWDLAWGAAFGVVLAYLLLEFQPTLLRVPGVVQAALYRLGDVSYSVYLLHFPWLVFVTAAWLMAHPGAPQQPQLALAGVLSGLGLGWLGWYLVERRCAVRATSSARPSEG